MATTLLENIKERKLDVLFEAEEKLLNGQSIQITESLQLCVNNDDALRLILITLCSRPLTAKERKDILTFMEEKGIDPSAYHFVQKLKALSDMTSHPSEEVHQGAGTKTVNMFSKLLNHSSRFVMEGVKNLLPKKHNLPITKVFYLNRVRFFLSEQSVEALHCKVNGVERRLSCMRERKKTLIKILEVSFIRNLLFDENSIDL